MKTAWQLLHRFGGGWVTSRLLYAVKRRTGWMAWRAPAVAWQERPLASLLADPSLAWPAALADHRGQSPAHFFFSLADRHSFAPRLASWDEGTKRNPAAQLERLRQGRLEFFEHAAVDVGYPPLWHRNALSNQTAPHDRHWSRIGDFDYGDIKVVWEPSRFSFAYSLSRAYWRSGSPLAAETFWELLEDWRKGNPPNFGANWKCGQETALRVMAWCFALHALADAPATTPERVAMLVQMLGISGERIEANIGYALSQQNNHGVSEATGLWTIGVLVPELRSARRWRHLGRRLLHRLARTLIYDDGSFTQHSFNYQRVMLHDMVWSLRLAELAGEPFEPDVLRRIAASADLLYQVQDASSGAVPNYGPNDGALVLPLTNCDYEDFRPVVQAATFATSRTRRYEPGPWDEELLWLFGPEALDAPQRSPARVDLAAHAGGYYTLRSPISTVFTRAAEFRHRPGHADQLHADVWWRGVNVAVDAGTYFYNAPPPWDNALGTTRVHNTVSVDHADQMTQAGRFLWLDWATATVDAQVASPGKRLAYWQGRHDGYERLNPPVTHARAICRLGDEHWLVLDRLSSAGEHDYRLHWLLPDFPFRWDAEARQLGLDTPSGTYGIRYGTLEGPGGATLARADRHTVRGWQSRYYASKEPALSLDVTTRAAETVFWTLLGPDSAAVGCESGGIRIEASAWQAEVRLGGSGSHLLVTEMHWSSAGGVSDRLQPRPAATS